MPELILVGLLIGGVSLYRTRLGRAYRNIYLEGYEAGKWGLDRYTNPYEGKACREWNRGYNSGEIERKKNGLEKA